MTIFDPMPPKKSAERFKMSPLSEFYEDLLRADAFLGRNSLAAQGKSLLQAKLNEKEAKIRERVTYLARKRNISFDEMWQQIQTGTAQQMSQDEYTDLTEEQDAD